MVTAPVLSYGLCRFASHYSPPKNYWLLGMARILSVGWKRGITTSFRPRPIPHVANKNGKIRNGADQAHTSPGDRRPVVSVQRKARKPFVAMSTFAASRFAQFVVGVGELKRIEKALADFN